MKSSWMLTLAILGMVVSAARAQTVPESVRQELVQRMDAVRDRYDDVAELLTRYPALINMPFPGGEDCPLCHAAASGNYDLVWYLLQRGAAVDGVVSTESPLAVAKDGNIAGLLLSRGANVNAANRDGDTVLMQQAWRPTPDVVLVRLLTGYRVNVNARNAKGETALHRCIDPDVVVELVFTGADKNAKDNLGNTPLMRMVMADETATAELLLERGADPNIPNAYRQTPYSAAVERKLTDLATHIQEHGGQ